MYIQGQFSGIGSLFSQRATPSCRRDTKSHEQRLKTYTRLFGCIHAKKLWRAGGDGSEGQVFAMQTLRAEFGYPGKSSVMYACNSSTQRMR